MRIPGGESGSINGKDRDPLHFTVAALLEYSYTTSHTPFTVAFAVSKKAYILLEGTFRGGCPQTSLLK